MAGQEGSRSRCSDEILKQVIWWIVQICYLTQICYLSKVLLLKLIRNRLQGLKPLGNGRYGETTQELSHLPAQGRRMGAVGLGLDRSFSWIRHKLA